MIKIELTKFLNDWQANRNLTRKVIMAFPEKELFNFSIGGMRTFADICKELLAISQPGVQEFITLTHTELNESFPHITNKDSLLKAWDETTEYLNQHFFEIPIENFDIIFKSFGMFESKILDSLYYFIENEIHHRGQGYVYLRAIGINPPAFYDKY